jgi:ABC-type transport system involved in Fe-S cluster assembly fused permease/ATPase subunit
VNELDNATSSKAVDALLSFETVALFNNQRLEVGRGGAVKGEGGVEAGERICCPGADKQHLVYAVVTASCSHRSHTSSLVKDNYTKLMHIKLCLSVMLIKAVRVPIVHVQVAQYNTYLKGYFQAMTETDRLAATLNSGQAVVLTLGLMSIMITALRAT